MLIKYALKITFHILFFLLLFLGSSSYAADVSVDTQFAREGNTILARVAFRIPEGYNSYANESGGAGKPTRLDFVVEGEGAMPVLYPEGIAKADIYDPSKIGRVYVGEVALFVSLPANSGGQLYAGTLDMLLCSPRHCLPLKKVFSGEIPSVIPSLADTAWALQADDVIGAWQTPSGEIHVEEGTIPPRSVGAPVEKKDENTSREMEPNAAPMQDTLADSSKKAEFPEFEPHYLNEDLEIYSLGKALLFGLLSGLILNIMPCVLPVLTLKVSALMAMGNYKNPVKRREFRQHNLYFAGGILTFFSLLAFLLGAADGIWGQLYQNHALLLIMMLLVFFMGLSMLGVFTLPTFDIRVDANVSHPCLKAYLTGLLSTFLATPCSGPLLGGVLAWAFTQPLAILMTIFWSVGFGMALPYVIFAIWPDMARILPRPGNWMLIFERILGFLLLGTAIYLISIMPSAKYLQIMILLLLCSVAAWVWGNFCGLGVSRLRRFVIGGICCAWLAGSVAWVLSPEAAEAEWFNFSGELFHGSLGEKNLLVEFTADWCPNCKYLEATVLTPANLEQWRKKYGLRIIKADLTNTNPEAEKLLELLGSRSIPLTALFPTGQRALQPLVLRDLYNTDMIRKAMHEIFNK